MKKLPFLTLTALLLASGAANSAEQVGHRPRDPGINARQYHEQQRIRQGIRSGELSAHEARELRRERQQIQRKERLYKSDGVLSRPERKDLHRDLNRFSRDIYAQTHDAERRPNIQ